MMWRDMFYERKYATFLATFFINCFATCVQMFHNLILNVDWKWMYCEVENESPNCKIGVADVTKASLWGFTQAEWIACLAVQFCSTYFKLHSTFLKHTWVRKIVLITLRLGAGMSSNIVWHKQFKHLYKQPQIAPTFVQKIHKPTQLVKKVNITEPCVVMCNNCYILSYMEK